MVVVVVVYELVFFFLGRKGLRKRGGVTRELGLEGVACLGLGFLVVRREHVQCPFRKRAGGYRGA